MSVATPTIDSTAADDPVVGALKQRFGDQAILEQATLTGMPVLWVAREKLTETLSFLREMPEPFEMLYDLSAVDERLRGNRRGLPAADYTVFYQLLSISRNRDMMLKVALHEDDLALPTSVVDLPQRQLVRARSVGHVRRRLSWPSAPDPDPDAADLDRASAAQGSSARGPRSSIPIP